MNLSLPRTVQFTQEFSRTSYEDQTNRNTLIDSIGLNVSVLDWRFVRESLTEQIDFGLVTAQQVTSTVNFGNI